MGIYIKGMGVISPQKTFDSTCLEEGFLPFSSNRMSCREPDYSLFIDAKQIRRMSKVIKMGVTSSKIAMKDAGIEKPDSVIVGTTFGCLEDTSTFLTKMVENKEEMLNPTPFIHSTHNTIASQIALIFDCKGYNSTYSHLNISFESALTDAMLLLKEGSVENVLVGGVDELTDTSFNILNRLGHYKRAEELADEDLYHHSSRGSAGGEGSAFFLLVNIMDDSCYAEINAVQTISFSTPEDVVEKAKAILNEQGIEKPDVLISGNNGDVEDDKIFDQVAAQLNMQDRVMKYKHLSGEFSTSTGFALWLASTIIKRENIPSLFQNDLLKGKKIKNILIHNQFKNIHHSLILISAC